MKLLLLCLCVAVANAGLAPLFTSKQRSIPDSWIVKIKDLSLLDQVADDIQSRFTKLRLPSPKVTKIRSLLPALTLKIPSHLVTDIRSIDGIEYIEQDSIMTLAVSQANPTWGIDRVDSRTGIDGSYNYNSNVQGNGVNIYVVDTGIQTTHNAFGGRAHILFGDTDDQGHGTHCSGTAAGDVYGLARQANIYSVKVCIKDYGCPVSTTLEGVQAIINHGNRGVVSMSLSGTYYSPSMNQMAQDLWDNGFLLSHAAGNSNDDACNYSPQMNWQYLVVVGATDSNDQRAYFSNYGACVPIFAPGVSIVSAGYSTSSYSGSATMSGTSMACPHVTGAAALLFGADQSATPQTVMDYLLNDATLWVVTDSMGSHNRFLYVSPT